MGADGYMNVGMVAAAAGALIPQQNMMLRGSQASQSLAADTANEVFQTANEVFQTAGAGSGGGDAIAGGGLNKVVEVVAVQAIGHAVGAALPLAVKAVAGVCGPRRRHDDDDHDDPGAQTPNAPEKPLPTPDLSPVPHEIPVHHRITSENSQDEDGVDYPSEDLRQSSLDTLARRESGFQILEKLEKDNQNNNKEIKELGKKFETDNRLHTLKMIEI